MSIKNPLPPLTYHLKYLIEGFFEDIPRPIGNTKFPIIIPWNEVFKVRGDTNKPYLEIKPITDAMNKVRRSGNWPKELLRYENLDLRLASELLEFMDTERNIFSNEDRYVLILGPNDYDREKALEMGFGLDSLNNYNWTTLTIP